MYDSYNSKVYFKVGDGNGPRSTSILVTFTYKFLTHLCSAEIKQHLQ